MGLVRFDCSVLFSLPTSRGAGYYSRFFQRFCVCGWLSRELKNIHMDDYLQFFHDPRFVCLDNLQLGLKIEGMVTFLSSGPELSKRDYSSFVSNCAACVFGTWCRIF